MSRTDRTIRLDRDAAALLAGVGRATLERALASGDLVADDSRTGAGGRGRAHLFSVDAVAAWLAKRRDEAAPPDERAAKLAKLSAEAKLRELDLEERQGALIPAADVERDWRERVLGLRESFRSLPGLSVQAGLVAPADERKLENMIRDILISYARAILEEIEAKERASA